jgi:hypothetical protein
MMFIERIEQLREERQLRKLAAVLDIDFATCWKIEKGEALEWLHNWQLLRNGPAP